MSRLETHGAGGPGQWCYLQGGTRLVRINHPTETVDGQYHGNFLGWHNRSRFLQDVMEVRGGARYIDQVSHK